MGMTLQDLDVAVQSNASATQDVRNDLDILKTAISSANGKILAEITRLTDLLAQSGGSVDTTPFIQAIQAAITVQQGVSADLQALTTSENAL